MRQYVSSLADNWNPNHPDGNQLDFTQVRQPMSYFPWIFDAEATATINPDFVTEFEASEDLLTLTYTAQPRGRVPQR